LLPVARAGPQYQEKVTDNNSVFPLLLPETSAGANSPVLDWLLRHPAHVVLLAVRPVLALPITLLNLLKGLCHERINFF
jgi:hypothetical protein